MTLNIAFISLALVQLATLALVGWLLHSHAKERQAASDKWAAILNDLSAQFTKDLEATLGVRREAQREIAEMPQAVADAIYIPREPDAMERATREVAEHTKQTGMAYLREQYRLKGIMRADDELAREVAAVAAGLPLP